MEPHRDLVQDRADIKAARLERLDLYRHPVRRQRIEVAISIAGDVRLVRQTDPGLLLTRLHTHRPDRPTRSDRSNTLPLPAVPYRSAVRTRYDQRPGTSHTSGCPA